MTSLSRTKAWTAMDMMKMEVSRRIMFVVILLATYKQAALFRKEDSALESWVMYLQISGPRLGGCRAILTRHDRDCSVDTVSARSAELDPGTAVRTPNRLPVPVLGQAFHLFEPLAPETSNRPHTVRGQIIGSGDKLRGVGRVIATTPLAVLQFRDEPNRSAAAHPCDDKTGLAIPTESVFHDIENEPIALVNRHLNFFGGGTIRVVDQLAVIIRHPFSVLKDINHKIIRNGINIVGQYVSGRNGSLISLVRVCLVGWPG